MPESFNNVTLWFSLDHIKKLEEHYQKAGKPKKSYIDALYITRQQVERAKGVKE